MMHLDIMGSTGNSAILLPSLVSSPRSFNAPASEIDETVEKGRLVRGCMVCYEKIDKGDEGIGIGYENFDVTRWLAGRG